MVNRGSEDFNQQQWYPQLPEGYENINQQRHGGSQPGMPGQWGQQPGGPGFQPVQWGQQPGMPGFPPGNWGQQPGRPGFQPGPGGQQPGRPGFPPRPGGQQPGRPGFPPGPGGPGFPPGRPPGQQQGNQAPTSAPPNRTPDYPSQQLFAVDPGAIRGCMYRFTYIWLSRRQGFWFYPVFVGRTSVAGYRWNSRRRRWEYTGLDLNNINQFTCF